MHKIINKIFALSLFAVAATFTAHDASAQLSNASTVPVYGASPVNSSAVRDVPNSDQPATPYAASEGARFGLVPSMGGALRPRFVDTIQPDLTTYTVEDTTVNNALGCNFDTHQTVLSTLNVDSGEFVDYLSSPLGTFMISALYTSPATAAAYDSLYAFGSSRAQVLQDRCNTALTATDDAAQARWEAIQECIENTGATDLEEYAQAYKACLLSPEYTVQTGEVLPQNMRGVQARVLSSAKWAGTMFDNLSDTSFCNISSSTGATASSLTDCFFMGFIPNYRWCTGGETTLVPATTTGVIKSAYRGCSNTGGMRRVADESITMRNVYDLAFTITGRYVEYALKFAERLKAAVGVEKAFKIATAGETITEPLNNITGVNEMFYGYDEMVEFLSFAGCDSGNNNALVGFEALGYYFQRANTIDATLVPLDGPPGFSDDTYDAASPTSPNPIFNAFDDPWFDFSDDAGTTTDASFATAFRHSTATAATAPTGRYDSSDLETRITYAVSCIMKHHLRASLQDYLNMVIYPERAQAAGYALRNKWAFLTTELLYRFVKQKLEMAHAELLYAAGHDTNAAAPHIKDAVRSTINGLENQIRSLQAMKESQKDFADILYNVYKNEARPGEGLLPD